MKEKNNLIPSKIKSSIWDEGIFVILIMMVILVPVVFYPYSIPVFAPAKDLVFQLLSLFGFVLLILKYINTRNPVWTKSALDKPILIYLLFGFLSLIWSVNIYNSILALPLFLVGPILYFIITKSINKQKKIEILLRIIIVVGTCMGAYGILQYLGIDFEFWVGNLDRRQVFGLFGNVNYFAEYIILPLSLTIGLILSEEKTFLRIFLLSALIIMSTALFLTFTRGSYLAIAITVPVTLFLYYRSAVSEFKKQRYKKFALYLLLLLIIALTIIYIPHPLNQRETTLGRLRHRITIESLTSGNPVLRRVATWKFTWMMIEERPLLGSGIGTYGYQSLKYQADFFAQGENRDIYPHGYAVQAHNEYLQIWSELGIFGLLIFLFILFTYYRNMLKHFRKLKEKHKTIAISLAGGITAVLVDALFGFPLQLAASLSLFWLFIGLTVVQITIANSDAGEKIKVNQKTVKGAININEINNTGQQGSNSQKAPIMIKKIILSFLVVAVTVVFVLLLIRPFMASVYLYHGNKQNIIGNYNKAIIMYEKGLQWNPWQGRIYCDIGNILVRKGLFTPALEYFLKGEKFIDYHYLPQSIAEMYVRSGEIGNAIPYLEKAIKYQKDKSSMLPLQLQLGNFYLTMKDYQNAERHFSGAIEINPFFIEAYYGLGRTCFYLGQEEKAIEMLQKVIELDPESKVAGYAGMMLQKIEVEEESEQR